MPSDRPGTAASNDTLIATPENSSSNNNPNSNSNPNQDGSHPTSTASKPADGSSSIDSNPPDPAAERDLKARSLRNLALSSSQPPQPQSQSQSQSQSHSNPNPTINYNYESGTDTETESNLSRPPSPDKHKYPKHRLSGLQAKDSHVVKHEKSLDGSLALTRETSPCLEGMEREKERVPGSEKATESAMQKNQGNLQDAIPLAVDNLNSQLPTTSSTANVGEKETDGGFKRSKSPPPRALSPQLKGSSSTKVSSGASNILPHSNVSNSINPPPPPSSSSSSSANPNPSSPSTSTSTTTTTPSPNAAPPINPSSSASKQPPNSTLEKQAPVKKEEKEKDNRGMLRRMLSSSDRGREKEAIKEKERERIAMANANGNNGVGGGRGSPSRRDTSTSSRGSTPPTSPKAELDDPSNSNSLLNAVRGMGLNHNGSNPNPSSGGNSLTSPNNSQPPSRNVSLKRPEGRYGNNSSGVGGDPNQNQALSPPPESSRLTAEALRSWDEKAKNHSVAPPPTSWTGKVISQPNPNSKREKDSDAKSTASSTLREMIMGGPKLNRRGSSTSQAGKSDSENPTNQHQDSKSNGKTASNKGSTKGSNKGSKNGDAASSVNTTSLLKKYGVCEKAAIGKGATAVVRLAHKWDRGTDKLYAVKEFRKRRKNETEKEYVKKLTSEFCISSTLHHINVVETVDLVQDEAKHWCEVMEYCPGGDLYAAIKRGGMSQKEVECCFKQTLNGIAYLHSMGVAHRDIKPENLLLDATGHIKITDFGVSDVFRMCWEKSTHYSKGLCGSEPYIAPEQFECKEYDARLVDVWAAAIVFYCMQFQELPWRVAKMSDPTFKDFVHSFHSSNAPAPLSNLSPRDCRPLLKKMLCPDPKGRWGTDEIMKDPWLLSVEICEDGKQPSHSHHLQTKDSS